MCRLKALLGALVLVLSYPTPVRAQTYEQPGVRALGFGGAFVAVADDATAVWWNPAALATGPFFNVVLERQHRRREPASDIAALERSGVDQSVTGFALATLPLGLSYYRTRYTQVPAGQGIDPQPEGAVVSSLVAHQTGVTLLQSITSGLVIGSTLKFVRGIVSVSSVDQGDTGEALDEAADLIGQATNRFDADLAVHWNSGRLRAGLTLRNASEPSFTGPDGQEVVLERQARAGVAFAVRESTTVAADVDLTEQTEDPAGRRLAMGIEQRFLPRFAVRAGLRVVMGDDTDPVAAVGASVAIRAGIWADGFWSRGEHEDDRWGLAARVAF
jgi:hypothetical protein